MTFIAPIKVVVEILLLTLVEYPVIIYLRYFIHNTKTYLPIVVLCCSLEPAVVARGETPERRIISHAGLEEVQEYFIA